MAWLGINLKLLVILKEAKISISRLAVISVIKSYHPKGMAG
jgi:hypothetical protein